MCVEVVSAERPDRARRGVGRTRIGKVSAGISRLEDRRKRRHPVAHRRMHNQRLAPNAMEPRVAIAEYDSGTQNFTGLTVEVR